MVDNEENVLTLKTSIHHSSSGVVPPYTRISYQPQSFARIYVSDLCKFICLLSCAEV